LPADIDLSGRIETEQQNDQNECDCRYAHGFFHRRQYFLKNLKIDISQKHEISYAMLWRSTHHVSAVDSEGRTIWIVDAHRGDGKRLVVRADEKLTAFMELESATRAAT
jgi:hypothetical protein